MDDPIFDPWATRRLPARLVSESAPRRSPPSFAAVLAPSAEGRPPEGRRARWKSPRAGGVPLDPRPSVGSVSKDVRHASSPLHLDRAVPNPRDRSVAGGDVWERTVWPHIEKLTTRLAFAGHLTMIADRTSEMLPTVRLRVRPWSAPFDDPSPARDSVLELQVDHDDMLVARLWLDTLGREPSEELRCVDSSAASEWMERLLLHFVERALRAL